MKTLGKDEERKLVSAIERAIMYTNKGQSPNDAITKVAKEDKLTPPFIHRMVEAFNKSKSVYTMKEASESDRHKPFELANADVIVSNVYAPAVEKEAADVTPLNLGFRFGVSQMFSAPGTMQKSATAHVQTEKDLRDTVNQFFKQASIAEGVLRKLHTDTTNTRYEFEKALEKVAEHVLGMPDKMLQKVAQNVVNGYPGTGKQLMAIIRNKTRRSIPELNKTANAVIFPATEPYIAISQVYEYAEKLASCEREEDKFEKETRGLKKEAKNFLETMSANALANIAAPGEITLGESLQGTPVKKKIDSDELLDPEFYNRLKSYDAKRALMSLFLYDKDLKDYKYSDIVEAYNTSVGSVPEAQLNPVVLKTLMMKNLESSGIKDVFELSQEQALAQNMTKADKERRMLQVMNRPVEQPEERRVAITNADTNKGKSFEERANAISQGMSGMAKSLKPSDKKDLAPQPGDGIDWHQMAIDTVLKGGNKKAPMNTAILQGWLDPNDKNTIPLATTIDDIARDLKVIHTRPRNEWGEAGIRGDKQFGIIGKGMGTI